MTSEVQDVSMTQQQESEIHHYDVVYLKNDINRSLFKPDFDPFCVMKAITNSKPNVTLGDTVFFVDNSLFGISMPESFVVDEKHYRLVHWLSPISVKTVMFNMHISKKKRKADNLDVENSSAPVPRADETDISEADEPPKQLLKITETVHSGGVHMQNPPFGRFDCGLIGVFVSADFDTSRLTSMSADTTNIITIPRYRGELVTVLESLTLMCMSAGRMVVSIRAAPADGAAVSSSFSKRLNGWATATVCASSTPGIPVVAVDVDTNIIKHTRVGCLKMMAWIQRNSESMNALKSLKKAFAKYMSPDSEVAEEAYKACTTLQQLWPVPGTAAYGMLDGKAILGLLHKAITSPKQYVRVVKDVSSSSDVSVPVAIAEPSSKRVRFTRPSVIVPECEEFLTKACGLTVADHRYPRNGEGGFLRAVWHYIKEIGKKDPAQEEIGLQDKADKQYIIVDDALAKILRDKNGVSPAVGSKFHQFQLPSHMQWLFVAPVPVEAQHIDPSC